MLTVEAPRERGEKKMGETIAGKGGRGRQRDKVTCAQVTSSPWAVD